jgi:N,N'-diacetyllegionaminate synthase
MKVKIIAEIGQAHEGSLGIAHSYIEALSNTGIDIIKFQTHIAEAESSSEEPFRVKFSYEDKTRFDYWKRMEFTLEQWIGIKNHCDQKGLEFMSTPTCLAAVDLLEKVGVKSYKVGSGDITNLLLLEKIAQTGKPIIISSGMSSITELQQAVDLIHQNDNQISILQCTSKYPTKPSDMGFNLINLYRTKFNVPIGFSDHSGTIFPSLAATALGAQIIEFHVVFDRMIFGPDSKSSLNINEIKTLSKGIRFIENAQNYQHENDLDDALKNMKNIFEKSLSVNKNLFMGHIISFDDLESKKPSNLGIPAKHFDNVVGKRLNKDKNKFDFLNYEDIG